MRIRDFPARRKRASAEIRDSVSGSGFDGSYSADESSFHLSQITAERMGARMGTEIFEKNDPHQSEPTETLRAPSVGEG